MSVLVFYKGTDNYLVKTKYQGITYHWANTQVRPYTGPIGLSGIEFFVSFWGNAKKNETDGNLDRTAI
jgi:hypothetical protein